MAVTIKDIAAAVGVSRGTVDRVVNHRGGVSDEVARQVERAVQEMGYLPNRAGKILAARKKPVTIGCLLPSFQNSFFHDVIQGFEKAERELSDFGLSIRLKRVKGYDVESNLAALRGLLEENVSALCVATVDDERIISLLNQAAGGGIPVAAINIDLEGADRLFYLGSDYLASGKTAAGLFSKMLKDDANLLVFTASRKIRSHNQRIEGFTQVLRDKKTGYTLVDVLETQDDSEVAYRKAVSALEGHPEINYIYITTSGSAPGVCKAVEDLGRKGEILVIAFDDTLENKTLMRSDDIGILLCQESFRQGYDAINLLFHYLAEGVRPEPAYYTDTVIKIKENL